MNHMRIYVFLSMFIYIFLWMVIYVYICVCVCLYVCMCVCLSVCIVQIVFLLFVILTKFFTLDQLCQSDIKYM